MTVCPAYHEAVDQPLRRPGMPRRYLPPESHNASIAPEARFGKPRLGHGTMYLHKTENLDGETVWAATWLDEYPEPDQDGAQVGTADFEGDRAAVLEWVRSQPAAAYVMATENGWAPFTMNNPPTDVAPLDE